MWNSSSALRSLTSSEKYGSFSKQLTRLITSQRWEPFESRLFLSLFCCCCWVDLLTSHINLSDGNSRRRPGFSHTAGTTYSISFVFDLTLKAETKQTLSGFANSTCLLLPGCKVLAGQQHSAGWRKPVRSLSENRAKNVVVKRIPDSRACTAITHHNVHRLLFVLDASRPSCHSSLCSPMDSVVYNR